MSRQFLLRRTWPVETGLAGWSSRIRTWKCHKIASKFVAEAALGHRSVSMAGGRLQGGNDMTKKRDTGRKQPKLQEEKALSRRDFFKSGAAAGVSAAVL